MKEDVETSENSPNGMPYGLILSSSTSDGNKGEAKLASQLTETWPESGLFSSPHPTLFSVSLSFTLSLAPATQNAFSRWEDWQPAPLPCVIK